MKWRTTILAPYPNYKWVSLKYQSCSMRLSHTFGSKHNVIIIELLIGSTRVVRTVMPRANWPWVIQAHFAWHLLICALTTPLGVWTSGLSIEWHTRYPSCEDLVPMTRWNTTSLSWKGNGNLTRISQSSLSSSIFSTGYYICQYRTETNKSYISEYYQN